MSGSPLDTDPFLCAIHESGHFLVYWSLVKNPVPVYLTIKPYNDSAGSCAFRPVKDPLPLEIHMPYAFGGLCAEVVHVIAGEAQAAASAGDDAFADFQSKGKERLQALIAQFWDGAHYDFASIHARADFQKLTQEETNAAVYDAFITNMAFLLNHYSDLTELARELVARETLHGDEPIMHLLSPNLFARRHRKSRQHLNMDGTPIRPDIDHQESYSEVFNRLGKDAQMVWISRIVGAYEKARGLLPAWKG